MTQAPQADTADRTDAVNVQTVLNEHPFSRFQWVIFALCFTIVLLDGFDTAAIGYIAPSLISEWGISKPALAPVLSAALFGLAAGAVASGPLADRFGRKAVLLASVLVMGLACLVSGWSRSIEELTITLQELASRISPHGTFNFLLSNGEALWSHATTNLFYTERCHPFAAAQLADEDLTVDFSTETTPQDKVAVIVTAPLTKNETWTQFEKGVVNVFVDGRLYLGQSHSKS